MVDIPEHLLLRSAEARAKALGISVEQALAEMKGETEPTVVSKEPEIEEAPAAEVKEEAPEAEVKEEAPAAEVKAPEKKIDSPEEVDFAPEVILVESTAW